jgi:meiotic recombination protein DMC1
MQLQSKGSILTSPKLQVEALDSLVASFATNEYRLLIVDSLIALFRTDYTGRGELQERQHALGQYMRRLKAIGEEFNIAILLVR